MRGEGKRENSAKFFQILPQLLGSLLLATTVYGCSPNAWSPPTPPNILLLIVDCLRSDHVGFNGYPRQTTPNIDALANEGISFTNAFAQSHWTRPSLPTILTGLYPSEHGLTGFSQGQDGSTRGNRLPLSINTMPERLREAGYSTALIGFQAQLTRKFGLDQGFDLYKSNAGKARDIHKRFRRWLKSKPRSPFFAYLHYLDIHWPYCPQETLGTFLPGPSRLRLCYEWADLKRNIRSGKIALTETDRETLIARYDEELLALDARIGELMVQLDRRMLLDELLIVISSDHGEEFLEHGGIGHKVGLYDELISIPLIFRLPASWPGPRGIRLEGLVEHTDLAPTLLEAAGLEDVAVGRSLFSALVGAGKKFEGRRFVVSEAGDEVAIRTENKKLLFTRSTGKQVLFDLESDPGERENVAADQPSEAARLMQYYEEWQGSLRIRIRETIEVDTDTKRELRALGYLE